MLSLLRIRPTSLLTSRRYLTTTSSNTTTALLNRLGISTSEVNHGVFNSDYIGKATGSIYASINPSTGKLSLLQLTQNKANFSNLFEQNKKGKVLAEIREASKLDVEETIVKSREAFLEWRKVPAPKRGEILRLIRVALADQIDGK